MFTTAHERNTSLDAFRQEVAAFCARELPQDIARKVALGQHIEKEEHHLWHTRLGAKGWLCGAWPKEHGGQGWSPAQKLVFEQETAKAFSPWIVPFGPTMVGPVLYTFGSPEQKRRFLPGVLSGETWWCQGYSEPGAGSDLASLKTRAVREGDHYVVTGQKIWTTLAHWAEWMFCLVRTGDTGKPQDGISFLLIDMATPGITVKPIISIDLAHHLNEVFFDAVRVPAANLIGEVNKGWTYAKFLLSNERIGIAEIGKYKRMMGQLEGLAAATHEAGRPLAGEPGFKRKRAELSVRLATLEALIADQLSAIAAGRPAEMGASILKIRASELQQAILESAMEVLARHGLAYETEALMAGWNGEPVGPFGATGMIYEHLYRRAASIYGGSNEIQRNIIAKQALGL